MKLLYIDRSKEFSDIRIGEKKVFGDYLPKLGYDVHFLLLKSKENKEKIHHVKIWYRINTYIFTYFNFDFFVVFYKLHKLNKSYRFDLIISRKNLSFSLPTLLFCKIYKIPFVYILSFPKWEIIAQKGPSIVRPVSVLVSKVYLILNIILIKHSDFIIPQTEYLWQKLSNKFNLARKDYLCIPMGFDTNSNIEHYHKETLRAELNLPLETPIIIYFGALDKERNPIFIINVINEVLLHGINVIGLIIGGTFDQIAYLKKHATKLTIENSLILMPKIQRKELNKYILASDLSISPIPPVPSFIISSPTKVIESLGFGIPVIANNEIYEHKQIIEDSMGGILVPYVVNDFSSAIMKVLLKRDLLNKMSASGKEYILQFRSYESLANKLHDAFNNIIY